MTAHREVTDQSISGPQRTYPGRQPAAAESEFLIRSDERDRIARELHDSTSQLLVALELHLIRLKQLPHDFEAPVFEDVMTDLRDTIGDLHEEIRQLGSRRLFDASTLPRELSVMAADFAHRTGLGVRTDVVALPSNVSPEVAGALYRVAQEALANVGRHARANNVRLTLSANDRSVALRVRDDGLGFPRDTAVAGRGRGIGNMRARLNEVGGSLKVGNRRRGAVVVAKVDLGTPAASAWPEVKLSPARTTAAFAS